MATHRIPILGFGTKPDSTGNCYLGSYDLLSTNQFWGHLVFVFDSTTVDHGLYGTFEVPQDYVGTAGLVIVWTTPATSGDVEWEFAYRPVGGNDTESLDQATALETKADENDTAPNVAHERMEYTISLTDGNFAAGDTVEFFLSRQGADAGDTIADDVMLFGLYFSYADA